MRELKFRAWSEETKSFEYFDLYEGTECGLTNLQIWARNNPIEQYTGLKDKNGKEIYEGDIVRVGGKWRFAVAYTRAFCAFELQNLDREECMDLRHEHMKRYEVIGNIHENPELCGEEEE